MSTLKSDPDYIARVMGWDGNGPTQSDHQFDRDDLLEHASHTDDPAAAQALTLTALVHQVALLTEQLRISNQLSRLAILNNVPPGVEFTDDAHDLAERLHAELREVGL